MNTHTHTTTTSTVSNHHPNNLNPTRGSQTSPVRNAPNTTSYYATINTTPADSHLSPSHRRQPSNPSPSSNTTNTSTSPASSPRPNALPRAPSTGSNKTSSSSGGVGPPTHPPPYHSLYEGSKSAEENSGKASWEPYNTVPGPGFHEKNPPSDLYENTAAFEDKPETAEAIAQHNHELRVKAQFLEKELNNALIAQAQLLDETDKLSPTDQVTLRDQVMSLKQDLMNAEAERDQLLWNFNRFLPKTQTLEQENTILKKMHESTLTPQSIIKSMLTTGTYTSIYECKTYKQKIELLDEAMLSYSCDTIIVVVLFLKSTLSFQNFMRELKQIPRFFVLEQYMSYLKKIKDYDTLIQIYKYLQRDDEIALLMVEKTMDNNDIFKRGAELKKTMAFFEHHEGLPSSRFYREYLQEYYNKTLLKIAQKEDLINPNPTPTSLRSSLYYHQNPAEIPSNIPPIQVIPSASAPALPHQPPATGGVTRNTSPRSSGPSGTIGSSASLSALPATGGPGVLDKFKAWKFY